LGLHQRFFPFWRFSVPATRVAATRDPLVPQIFGLR
jgi:hypothetical protein